MQKILYAVLNNKSSQALIEGCIGIALLSFLFFLAIYLMFISDNYLSTALAARHAAWLKGNGYFNINNQSFLNDFFDAYYIDLVSSKEEKPIRYIINFGLNDKNLGRYPFCLLKSVYSIFDLSIKDAKEGGLNSCFSNCLSIESVAEWDNVKEGNITPL